MELDRRHVRTDRMHEAGIRIAGCHGPAGATLATFGILSLTGRPAADATAASIVHVLSPLVTDPIDTPCMTMMGRACIINCTATVVYVVHACIRSVHTIDVHLLRERQGGRMQ